MSKELKEQNAKLLAKCALLRDEIKDLKSYNWCLNILCSSYQEENAELLRKTKELTHRLDSTKDMADTYEEVSRYEDSSDRH